MSRAGKIGILLVLGGLLVTSMLSSFDLRAYTVQGNSMRPEYVPGDLIVTSTLGARDVQPGEIIVFTADWASEKYDHRVVHRVAAVGEIDGLPIAYTRGDNNLIADPRPVDLTANVQIVMFSIPSGGVVADLLAGPLFFALLITVAAGILGAIMAMSKPAVTVGARFLLRTGEFFTPETAEPPARDLRFPY